MLCGVPDVTARREDKEQDLNQATLDSLPPPLAVS